MYGAGSDDENVEPVGKQGASGGHSRRCRQMSDSRLRLELLCRLQELDQETGGPASETGGPASEAGGSEYGYEEVLEEEEYNGGGRRRSEGSQSAGSWTLAPGEKTPWTAAPGPVELSNLEQLPVREAVVDAWFEFMAGMRDFMGSLSATSVLASKCGYDMVRERLDNWVTQRGSYSAGGRLQGTCVLDPGRLSKADRTVLASQGAHAERMLHMVVDAVFNDIRGNTTSISAVGSAAYARMRKARRALTDALRRRDGRCCLLNPILTDDIEDVVCRLSRVLGIDPYTSPQGTARRRRDHSQPLDDSTVNDTTGDPEPGDPESGDRESGTPEPEESPGNLPRRVSRKTATADWVREAAKKPQTKPRRASLDRSGFERAVRKESSLERSLERQNFEWSSLERPGGKKASHDASWSSQPVTRVMVGWHRRDDLSGHWRNKEWRLRQRREHLDILERLDLPWNPDGSVSGDLRVGFRDWARRLDERMQPEVLESKVHSPQNWFDQITDVAADRSGDWSVNVGTYVELVLGFTSPPDNNSFHETIMHVVTSDGQKMVRRLERAITQSVLEEWDDLTVETAALAYGGIEYCSEETVRILVDRWTEKLMFLVESWSDAFPTRHRRGSVAETLDMLDVIIDDAKDEIDILAQRVHPRIYQAVYPLLNRVELAFDIFQRFYQAYLQPPAQRAQRQHAHKRPKSTGRSKGQSVTTEHGGTAEHSGTAEQSVSNQSDHAAGNSQSGSQPSSLTGTPPDSQSGSQPNSLTGTPPDSQSGSQPNSLTGTPPDSQSGSQPNSLTGTPPDSQSGSQPPSLTYTVADSQVDSPPDSRTSSPTGAQAGTPPGSQPSSLTGGQFATTSESRPSSMTGRQSGSQPGPSVATSVSPQVSSPDSQPVSLIGDKAAEHLDKPPPADERYARIVDEAFSRLAGNESRYRREVRETESSFVTDTKVSRQVADEFSSTTKISKYSDTAFKTVKETTTKVRELNTGPTRLPVIHIETLEAPQPRNKPKKVFKKTDTLVSGSSTSPPLLR